MACCAGALAIDELQRPTTGKEADTVKAEKEKGAVAAWSPLDNSLTALFRSQGLALPASLGGPASQQPGAVELVRASGHASSCDGGGELV